MSIHIHTTRAADEPTDLTDTGHCLSPVVAIAWPTCRPILQYTADEIADGVDLYTRAMKARDTAAMHRGDGDAPKR